MEIRLSNTTAMILLTIGSILGPPLAILLFGAIGFSHQGGILALPLSGYLMYCVLSKIQDRRKRKIFIISVYSYSGIWALAGVTMIFIVFPMAAQRSYCPLTGLGELLIGILCLAMAAISAIGLTVAIVIARSSIKKDIKIITISIATILLSLLLMACNVTEIDEQINVEDLVGVWQQEGFVERLNMINRQNRDEDGNFEVVAVYVTADGNLFVLSISGSCTEGLMTVVRHFRYEVTEEGLALSLTGMSSPWDRYHMTVESFRENESNSERPEMKISIRNNRMQLNDPTPQLETVFLYRTRDEVPYGWTDEERQEIIQTNEWVQSEIHEMAVPNTKWHGHLKQT